MKPHRFRPAIAILALAACSGGGGVTVPRAPDTASLPAPFAPLSFDVEVIGPNVTDGFECPAGILTSSSELPAVARRARFGVQAASGGCGPGTAVPAASPLPSPPAPAPSPLGSNAMDTSAIGQYGARLALPAEAGWSGALSFPPCPSGSSCDAGTTNGTIVVSALPATSAASYAFSLSFIYAGPETIAGPAPSAAEHPSPHVWLLYGAQPAAGASPDPVSTWVSGAPLTLGFPSVHVIPPPGSGLAASSLQLSVSQVVTPPVYEEAIFAPGSGGAFASIPLLGTAPPYVPYATAGGTAEFALPSTPFPFQTDFTQYEFTVSAGA